jgi:hypothetical protein
VDPTSLIVLVISLVVAVGGVVIALTLAGLLAWFFVRRAPEEPAAEPSSLTAEVEYDEPAAPRAPPEPAPAPDLAPPPEPPGLSMLPMGGFDDEYEDTDAAPTVRLRRKPRPPPHRAPALPVDWSEPEPVDEALPTELFQIGMQSGHHDVVEGDATEVFSVHTHDEFLLDDTSEELPPGGD